VKSSREILTSKKSLEFNALHDNEDSEVSVESIHMPKEVLLSRSGDTRKDELRQARSVIEPQGKVQAKFTDSIVPITCPDPNQQVLHTFDLVEFRDNVIHKIQKNRTTARDTKEMFQKSQDKFRENTLSVLSSSHRF